MRRADRLFQIVQHLRARRLTTAAQLAGWLEVSERTIYRDMRDLALSGVPVEGEAGTGYRLPRHFDAPPIMFTFAEIEALATGLRMVETWGGPGLAAAGRSALAKVASALPADRREEVERSRLFAPDHHQPSLSAMDVAREAINTSRRLRFSYVDLNGQATQRAVRPLALYYWGATWTLAAWCEQRQDFRNFRVDRLHDVELGDAFPFESGKSLDAFLEAMRRRDG